MVSTKTLDLMRRMSGADQQGANGSAPDGTKTLDFSKAMPNEQMVTTDFGDTFPAPTSLETTTTFSPPLALNMARSNEALPSSLGIFQEQPELDVTESVRRITPADVLTHRVQEYRTSGTAEDKQKLKQAWDDPQTKQLLDAMFGSKDVVNELRSQNSPLLQKEEEIYAQKVKDHKRPVRDVKGGYAGLGAVMGNTSTTPTPHQDLLDFRAAQRLLDRTNYSYDTQSKLKQEMEETDQSEDGDVVDKNGYAWHGARGKAQNKMHDGGKSWYERLGHGLKPRTADDAISLGWMETADMNRIAQISEKASQGKPLTDGEQALAQAYLVGLDAEAKLQFLGGATNWEKVGKFTGENAPFLVEMAITGGLGTAAANAAKGLVKRGIVKVAGNALKNRLVNGVAKGAASVIGSTAGGMAMAPFSNATWRNFTDRDVAQYQVGRDENGDFSATLSNPASLTERLGKAYINGTMETGSELLGSYIHGVKLFPNIKPGTTVGNIVEGLRGLTEPIRNFAHTPRLQRVNDYLGDTFKWYGLPVEIFTEEYSNLITPLLTGEPEQLKENFSSEAQWDLILSVVGMSAIMGTAQAPAIAADQIHIRRQASGKLRDIESPALKQGLAKAMAATSQQEQAKRLASIDWSGTSMKDRAAAVDYVELVNHGDVSGGIAEAMEQQEQASRAQALFNALANKDTGNLERVVDADGNGYFLAGGSLEDNGADGVVFVRDETTGQTVQKNVDELKRDQSQTYDEYERSFQLDMAAKAEAKAAEEEMQAIRDDAEAANIDPTPAIATYKGIDLDNLAGQTVALNNGTQAYVSRVYSVNGETHIDALPLDEAGEIQTDNNGDEVYFGLDVSDIVSVQSDAISTEPVNEQTIARDSLDPSIDTNNSNNTDTAQDISPQQEAEQPSDVPTDNVAEERVIPRKQDGTPDYAAMEPAVMFEAIATEFDEDVAREEIANQVKIYENKIAKLSKSPSEDIGRRLANRKAVADLQQRIAGLREVIGLTDESQTDSTVDTAAPSKTTLRQQSRDLGDYLSLEDKILRDIAEGQKFRWTDNGSQRGLATELGFVDSPGERKARFNILANNGITVDQYAERLEHDMDNGVIPSNWDADIRSGILDVLSRVRSNREAFDAAVALRENDPRSSMTEEEAQQQAQYDEAHRKVDDDIAGDLAIQEDEILQQPKGDPIRDAATPTEKYRAVGELVNELDQQSGAQTYVFNDISELPQGLSEQLEPGDEIDGITWLRDSYICAPLMTDTERVQRTYIHEVAGHRNVEYAIPKTADRTALWEAVVDDIGIEELRSWDILELNDVIDDYKRDECCKRELGREVIAYSTELNADLPYFTREKPLSLIVDLNQLITPETVREILNVANRYDNTRPRIEITNTGREGLLQNVAGVTRSAGGRLRTGNTARAENTGGGLPRNEPTDPRGGDAPGSGMETGNTNDSGTVSGQIDTRLDRTEQGALSAGEIVTDSSEAEDIRYRKQSSDTSEQERQSIISQSQADGTYLKAPNGADTNLTPSQWVIVRTRAFKEWFGDWESNPDDASKIIDDNGEPLVVYHQTNAKVYINSKTGENWDELDWQARDEWENRDDWEDYWKEQDFYSFTRINARQSIEMPAFFFSPENDIYHEYGDRTIDAFLNIRHPTINPHIEDAGVTNTAGLDAMNGLIAQGYDGFIRQEDDGTVYEFGAFHSNQIKSATENTGRFSVENDDIRYRSTKEASTTQLSPEEVNAQFNEQLQQQIDGTLPKGHVYELGMPSAALKAAGVPDLPIEMSAARLEVKASEDYESNHPFELSQIMNLPQAIAHPIAVFDSKTQRRSKVILTELTSDATNFIVAIKAENKRISGRRILEVNSIRSVYPKDYTQDIVNWINRGDLLKWVDKEKAFDWLGKQQSNSADVAIPIKGIDVSTNIIKNFTNPTILEGEKMATVETMSEELHVPVRIISDLSQIVATTPDSLKDKRGASGWYDRNSKEIVVVLPNCSDVAEVQKTVLHEAVGHYGIPELLGRERADELYRQVYNSLPSDIRESLKAKYGSETVAGDEYLAEMAEGNVAPGVFRRVMAAVRAFFRNIVGLDLKLSDADMRYILWRSKHNLQNAKTVKEAMDVIEQDQRMRKQITNPESLRKDLPKGAPKTALEYLNSIEPPAEDLYLRKKKKRQPSDPIVTTKQNFMTNMGRKLQDANIPVRQLQEYITKHGGRVGIENDLYSALNRAPGRATERIKRIDTQKFTPLGNTVREISKQLGEQSDSDGGQMSDYKQISDYVAAKSAYERHQSGIKAFSEDLSNPWNREYIENLIKVFEETVDASLVDKLWDQIRDITNQQLEMSKDYGLITTQTYRDIKARGWQYYVPLQGIDADFEGLTDPHDTFGDIFPGKKGSAESELFHKAKGRITKPEDVLGTLQRNVQRTILAGERNAARQFLLRLVEANPELQGDPRDGKHIFRIESRWFTRNPNDGVFDETETRPSDNEIAASNDARQRKKKLEKELRSLKLSEDQSIPENDRLAEYLDKRKDLLDRIEAELQKITVTTRSMEAGAYRGLTKAEEQMHTVTVRKNGVRYVVRLSDPTVANAINNNFEEFIGGWVGKTVDFMGKGTRVLASLSTSWNPEFIIPNNLRDAIWAGVYNAVDADGDFKGYIRNIPNSYASISRYHTGYSAPLTLNERAKYDIYTPEGSRLAQQEYGTKRLMDSYYDDFLMEGGLTGYAYMHDVKDYSQKLARRIKAKATLGGEVMGIMNNAAEFMGDMSEISTRFATFLSQVQMGRDVREAVNYAKNITINFNTRGEWGRGLNSLFMFYNASMQGVANVYRLTRRNPGRMSVAIVTMMGLGYGMSLLLSQFLAAGGDDGEEWNISDYERYTNFIMPGSWFGSEDGYIKIPIPMELRPFWISGVVANDLNQGKIKAEDAWKTILQASSDAFSPLEISADNPGKIITPTLLKPLFEVGLWNTDFAGRQINRVPFTTAQKGLIPDSQLGRRNANIISKTVTKWLNELGGGNQWTPAGMRKDGSINKLQNLLDISPSTLDHLAGSYTGGIGRMLLRTFDFITTDGDERTARNWPVFNRFYGEVRKEINPNTRYYDIRAKYQSRHDLFRNNAKNGVYPSYYNSEQEAITDYANIEAVLKKMQPYDKALSSMKKMLDGVEYGSEEYARITKAMNRVKSDFIKEYDHAFED